MNVYYRATHTHARMHARMRTCTHTGMHMHKAGKGREMGTEREREVGHRKKNGDMERDREREGEREEEGKERERGKERAKHRERKGEQQREENCTGIRVYLRELVKIVDGGLAVDAKIGNPPSLQDQDRLKQPEGLWRGAVDSGAYCNPLGHLHVTHMYYKHIATHSTLYNICRALQRHDNTESRCCVQCNISTIHLHHYTLRNLRCHVTPAEL